MAFSIHLAASSAIRGPSCRPVICTSAPGLLGAGRPAPTNVPSWASSGSLASLWMIPAVQGGGRFRCPSALRHCLRSLITHRCGVAIAGVRQPAQFTLHISDRRAGEDSRPCILLGRLHGLRQEPMFCRRCHGILFSPPVAPPHQASAVPSGWPSGFSSSSPYSPPFSAVSASYSLPGKIKTPEST